MNVIHKIGRLVILGLFASLLWACSSSGHRSPDDYHDPYYYDSYYRGGVYNHHNRYYRRPRPVRRPVPRRY